MAYQVLARKWRPQKFDDVIGQEHVTRTLKNAIRENRVAHAYLFVGPRGTGKTTTARIFAKALNCEKGPTTEPCDVCDSCKEIMGGNSMDVLEIDGASNNGVEQVRDLRDNARYTPARGPYKIYIIDEVHMLSIPAFNALLKTLEEPPPHVKFIMATTEPQKVPATILSRCQRFDLRRIPASAITATLDRIAKAEGITLDEDALLAIARGAEGGMRDAQSALDQLISFVGATIREEDVLSVFGLVSRGRMEDLGDAVLEGDVPRIIRIIADLDQTGKDMQRLMIELLEHFRNVLICLHAETTSDVLDLTTVQVESLRKQADKTSTGRLLHIVQILTETESRLRYALSRRTLVETALIRCARAAKVASLEEILKELNALKKAISENPLPTTVVSEPSSDPTEKKTTEAGVVAPSHVEMPESTGSSSIPTVLPGDAYQTVLEQWMDVVEQVSHIAPLARNYLLDSKPLAIHGQTLVVGFDPEFESSMESISVPRNRNALQKVLGRMLRHNVVVEFKIMDASDTLPGDIKIRAKPSALDQQEHVEDQDRQTQSAEQNWVTNPVVRKTLEEFNGEIVDIRE